jgi:hypothetical protein
LDAERAFNRTVEHGYLFDVPEEIKGHLQEEGLNVYKQRKSHAMNFKQYVKVSDLP